MGDPDGRAPGGVLSRAQEHSWTVAPSAGHHQVPTSPAGGPHTVASAADGDRVARGVPRTRFGEPKVALVIVGILFASILVLTGDVGAVTAGLVAAAAAVVAAVGALILWGTWRRRRFRAGAADRPFRPTGPEPGHDPLRPEVAALEAHGYVVEVFGRNAVDEALILLGHADGSVATVVSGRVLGRTRRSLALSSCLEPGRQWLLTGAGPMTEVTDAFWGDALPGTPSPAEVVRRHHETRAWFRQQGVAIHAISRGRAADDVIARIRTAAAASGPSVRVTPIGDPRHRPLADVPGVAQRLQLLRDSQGPIGAPVLSATAEPAGSASMTGPAPSYGVAAFLPPAAPPQG